MSKSYEFQGKNVEKALERASDELNIPAEKIKHEVVTYGSTGIFGLVGIKKAKIKVFVDEKKTNKSRINPTEKLPLAEDSAQTAEDTLSDDSTNARSDEEIIAFGTKALQTIVDGISVGATVELENTKDKLFFSISGGDSGVLIGKRGQTLEAIQYLLEKMINKRTTKKMRVMVDVEGYLEKRKINLQQMASRMAEKAKKIRKPVTIGQMNAHDRRIVHIHLKDENGIRTQSIGDGYYRKLMIFPKKQGLSKGRNNNSKV
jgi:spoIIIJ-associated protein